MLLYASSLYILCAIRYYMLCCYIYCAAQRTQNTTEFPMNNHTSLPCLRQSRRRQTSLALKAHRTFNPEQARRSELLSRAKSQRESRSSRTFGAKKSGQMHSRTSAPQNPKVFKHFQFYLSHIQLSITVQIKASNELNLLALSYSFVYSDTFFINPPAMYLIMLF